MAITIDWLNRVINVPKDALLLVQSSPTEIRQLDLDAFRLQLRDLEDSVEGIIYPITHNHVAPISVGGVNLARVIEIINDYSVTFEDGTYAVNLAGANSNVGDVVNVNNVSVRSANSAGLTYSKQVEDISFSDSRVWVDTTGLGQPGTAYPRGTSSDPVDNLADALTIIAARDLPRRIKLRGSLSVSASEDISNFNILGESVKLSSVDVAQGAATTNLVIQDCELTGDLNGNVTARRATSFVDLQDFDGTLHGTGLGGTVTLEMGVGAHEFIDCYSQEGGLNIPTVNCQDILNPEIYFRRYSGGVEITNFSSGNMTIGGADCRVILDPSCTGGTIKLYGTVELEDNSGPGCNVLTSGTVEQIVTEAVWQEDLSTYPADTAGEELVSARTAAQQGILTVDQLTNIDLIDTVHTLAAEIHRLQGLESGTPMTVTPTRRTAGSITLDITGDGETTSTVTRQ